MNSTTTTKSTPLVEHTIDVGHFIFYKNIVVGEFYEGVHVTFENASFPIQVATELYGLKEHVIYISHRKHSYSMDPISFREIVGLFPNFKAFGIVAQDKRRRMLANLERLFITKPIRVFDEMEHAMLWAEALLRNEKKGNLP